MPQLKQEKSHLAHHGHMKDSRLLMGKESTGASITITYTPL